MFGELRLYKVRCACVGVLSWTRPFAGKKVQEVGEILEHRQPIIESHDLFVSLYQESIVFIVFPILHTRPRIS